MTFPSRVVVGMLSAFIAIVALPGSAFTQATPDRLTIDASRTTSCENDTATFTAKRGSAVVSVTWTNDAPPSAGTLTSDAATGRATFIPAAKAAGTWVYGTVTVSATDAIATPKETVSKTLLLVGSCDIGYGGDLTRLTLGFEQIGASGDEAAQRYALDFFISRPLQWGDPDESRERHYLGSPLKWWGDVRIASYPQQVTSGAGAFATGFVSSAAAVQVNKLVQSAEFMTGAEFRLAGTVKPMRSIIDHAPQRFALMAFAGIGAVGPFPLVTDPPAVFALPDTGAQRRAFDAAYPGVTSKFVAFRASTPDRFLRNDAVGLRLYSYYLDHSAQGEPLQTAPAMVSISRGRNDLVSPDGMHAWHASAYYPFAFGDRTDPATLVVYFFGDVWSTLTTPGMDTQLYELETATENGQPVTASDSRVSILSLKTIPRDTFRLGLGVDLLKVWDRLVSGGTTK